MATFSISNMAKRAGISVRTLHHYDRIGLLVPSVRAVNGYRFYSASDLERLQDILFYRALGCSLKHISMLVSERSDQRRALLLQQRSEIEQHIRRLQAMKAQLDETLNEQEQEMNTENRLNALGGFDPDQYEDEVKERWEQTSAFAESTRRTQNYTKDDRARYKIAFAELSEAMANVMAKGFSASSPEAIDIVERMRLQIDTWFYPCSREHHAQLGDMYFADERFAKTYNDVRAGLAQFIRDAAQSNLEKN